MDNTTNKKGKSTLRAMKKSFKMQKESIKKKTEELSEIRDVEACMVETWPENRSDVQEVIKMYKNCDPESKRTQKLDHGSYDHAKSKENVGVVSDGVKNPTKKELLIMIDAKLAQVRKRIQILKSNDQGCNQDESG